MRILTLLLGLVSAGMATAQTPLSPPLPPAIWTAGGELAVTELSGNKSLTLIATGINLKRVAPDGAVVEGLAAMRYGRSDGTVASENYRAEVAAKLRPQGRVSPSFRLAANRDLIKGLNLRLAASAGVDIELFTDSPSELQVGVSLLQDREYRRLSTGSTLEPRLSFTRFDIRVRGKYPLREAVTLEHLTVMQPVAGDFNDYLLTTRAALQVFLTRQLAFQTSYLVEHDATPLPSVQFKDDRTLTVGILLRLNSKR
ncbi:MAG: DUF481 domain-containing protein [Gemmatimonadota bacterium]|nr:DUF481 domain-containing protein [Gemmatimonadota bacterium]